MHRSLLMSLLAGLSAASIVNIGDKPMQPISGRVCAIADMDKDGNTDLIMQQNDQLIVYLQAMDGSEFRKSSIQITLSNSAGQVSCAVGDFNGDTCPDLLVVQVFQEEEQSLLDKIKTVFVHPEDQYEARLYLNDGNNTFTEHQLCDTSNSEGATSTSAPGPAPSCPARFVDHPTLVDINGDGITDLLGFIHRSNSGEENKNAVALFCIQGDLGIAGQTPNFRHCEERFPPVNSVYSGFTPIFADLDTDLSAEFTFLEADKRKLVVWTQTSKGLSGPKWAIDDRVNVQLPELASDEKLASPLVADIDSDGTVDILIPVCSTSACTSVSKLWCISHNILHTVQIELNQASLQPEQEGQSQTTVLFRIGDFSQNGYPDLIATVIPAGSGSKAPMIFENIPSVVGANFSRKFELSKKAQRILPPLTDQLSTLTMSAFFDLKEDGNLDMMVEYNDAAKGSQVNFIRCDDKGDTTFLKVQVFTGTQCSGACCELASTDNTGRTIKIGSGIVWHGACVSIQMSESDAPGGVRDAAMCQLPQTSHRVLHNPFVLFGLSRSPNFVDMVNFGGPRLPNDGRFQRDQVKQVVPNSRVVVIPPELEGDHWTSRLFITPSQLIYLSLVVMASMCALLLVLIAILHFRERHEDEKERQSQTHRFHFDAM